MTHLDELAAALVDAEVTYEQRDRAFAHLTGCRDCHAEVDAQRRLKTLLAGCTAPEPDAQFMIRLRSIPGELRVEVNIRREPVAVGPVRPAAGRPAAGPRAAVRPRSRRRVAVGSVSALAVACGVAVLLGSEPVEPPVRPPVSTFVQDHNATTGNLPFRDPGTSVVFANLAR